MSRWRLLRLSAVLVTTGVGGLGAARAGAAPESGTPGVVETDAGTEASTEMVDALAPEAATVDAAPPPAPPPAEVDASAPSEPAPAPPETPSTHRSESPIDVRATFGVGAYHDNVGVEVLTPSVSFKVSDPLAGWGVGGSYLLDAVSAASPDIVASASPRFVEYRHAGTLNGSYKPGNYGIAAGAVVSDTPDYLSLGANIQLTGDFDEKDLTLALGYSFGHDVIGRTGTSFDVFSRRFDYHGLSASVTRVVNPSLLATVSSDFILERGDQSKPYRYIPIFSGAEAPLVPRGASRELVAKLRLPAQPLEQLPTARERGAVTGRVAWRLARSTLRAEERLYADSWGLFASTTDVRWFFDAADRITLWPHVRWHQQTGVAFWQRAYVGTPLDVPAIRTGDRELSPLTNLGLGGGVRFALGGPGAREDRAFTLTLDGTYTSFADALFVKTRLSALAAMAFEVAF